MTEDGLKSVIVKVGLTALVLACVGNVRDKPSDNRNTTVQIVEAATEDADEESESCNDVIGTYCGFVDGNAAKSNLKENQEFSMFVSGNNSKTYTTTEESYIASKTLNMIVVCVCGDLLWRLCVIKLAWRPWKIVLTFICLPLLIIFMVFNGMMTLVLPLLVVVGIVAIIVSIFKSNKEEK